MTSGIPQSLPYPVEEALVEATGVLFWYWNALARCTKRAGVETSTFNRLRAAGASKRDVMRGILDELQASKAPEAWQIQVELVRQVMELPWTATSGVDRLDARRAQEELRREAKRHNLSALRSPEARAPEVASSTREHAEAAARQVRAQALQRARAESRLQREQLFKRFTADLSEAADVQGRGYRLEGMIGEIAMIDGLNYTPPFRKGTATQTDGMVTFEGFQYLIEARWRSSPSDVNAIAALAHKASRNLTSTRGLFVSMAGFRDEVVREIETGFKNVLLMTGHEMAHIFEGRMNFDEAMRLKVGEAAAKGHVFFDVVMGRRG